MILKKREFFLLIFLILLQSCSGGRIGNFLESSFNGLEEINQDKDLKNLKNKKNVLNENKEINGKKSQKIKKVEKPKNIPENKKGINSEKILKQNNNKINNSSEIRKIELQSYKIILILKDVDPKDPTEELGSILSNSEVNFEIEKIERLLDSRKKSMNKN